MTASRELHLNLFHTATGYHDGAWRLAGSDPMYAMSSAYHVATAKTIEGACFDSVFLADVLTLHGAEHTNAYLSWDPLLVLATMAAATEHVGLIATMSTTFQSPYYLAKAFATLDQLSGGRAGWNIVTSSSDAEAQNFGSASLSDGATRYRRANEFVEVCLKLWNGWADDALTIDKRSGTFADMRRIPPTDHHGDWFDVRGPFQLPPTPQRFPVLVQAGSSEAGKDLAARHAEMMFTVQPEIDSARSFYAEMKARVAAHGRSPESMLIMPGLSPLLGRTEEEAEELAQRLMEVGSIDLGLKMIKEWVGIDLSEYPLDEPAPPLPVSDDALSMNRAKAFREYALKWNPTVRQLAARVSFGRAHHLFIGTAEGLADDMQEWFESGAADGFTIMPLVTPDGLDRFCGDVVPILQRRGLFRTCYEGQTLRDRLGVRTRA